ncbi:MAG TPA: [Fe-Fe] hydrogenase large subunit C-terminal domain-containing protein [Gemmatimonadaceae bacterium]|nr:[Fe-Fe] hydrogenase large subunit C-terminal domain-containing protein [Gemmatimonadaceae bacterium]
MPASLPNVERRPVATVAIVGNDAVLAAAPATPVQLAHACLQHGFSVAVPASWGDELLATEAVRRLVGREKGPAVMCVCPFVRSRLLASGADLAPFLVSLVSPPVATARYLRAAYGEHGVHITYIGACPGAEDDAIDVRLTPDTFFADIADRGIALSEQPLVFDSIVPPDRRRWCSAPGGVPSPDVLWNEADARTLVEIDRDDISTDLAQHIITHDNVLLDLAPGLGCACSGAIPSLPARSARVAVMALEPPRALGPVVDASSVIPLDAPVGTPPQSAPPGTPNGESMPAPAPRGGTTDVLDLEIGRPVWKDVAAGAVEPQRGSAEAGATPSTPIEVQTHAADGGLVPRDHWADRPREPHLTAPDGPGGARRDISEIGDSGVTPPTTSATHGDVAEFDTVAMLDPAGVIVAESDIETLVEALPDSAIEGQAEVPESADRLESVPEPVEPDLGAVRSSATPVSISAARRRTPVSGPVRHPAATIPRATASGGKSLPRAYVAKRRTPPTDLVAVPDGPSRGSNTPPEVMPPATDPATDSATDPATDAATLSPPVSRESSESVRRAAPLHADGAPAPQPTTPLPSEAGHHPSNSRPARATGGEQTRASAAAPSGGYDPIVIALVVTFVALAAFVVWTLQS